MQRIVFLKRSTLRVEFRRPQFDHEWVEFYQTEPDQVVERLRDATIVIVNKLPLRQRELTPLPTQAHRSCRNRSGQY